MHEYCKLTSSAQARLRQQDQMHLFKQTVGELLKRWRTPMSDLESLATLELLSFPPSLDLALEPPQEAELIFLLTLKRAGWSDELICKALSGLKKPYCYDATRMVYDITQRRWLTRSSVDARELTIEGRIARARDDRDVRTLREIANEAMKALVSLTEETLNQEEDL